jgi:hypothetical protein
MLYYPSRDVIGPTKRERERAKEKERVSLFPVLPAPRHINTSTVVQLDLHDTSLDYIDFSISSLY